jgi:hypothetical protein
VTASIEVFAPEELRLVTEKVLKVRADRETGT